MGGLDKAEKAEEQPSQPAAEPNSSSKPQFRALYSYAGQHDDELAFNAGDIITMISKDEEAWWKGELDGRVGVFPSNYVEEICKFEKGFFKKNRKFGFISFALYFLFLVFSFPLFCSHFSCLGIHFVFVL